MYLYLWFASVRVVAEKINKCAQRKLYDGFICDRILGSGINYCGACSLHNRKLHAAACTAIIYGIIYSTATVRSLCTATFAQNPFKDDFTILTFIVLIPSGRKIFLKLPYQSLEQQAKYNTTCNWIRSYFWIRVAPY